MNLTWEYRMGGNGGLAVAAIVSALSLPRSVLHYHAEERCWGAHSKLLFLGQCDRWYVCAWKHRRWQEATTKTKIPRIDDYPSLAPTPLAATVWCRWSVFIVCCLPSSPSYRLYTSGSCTIKWQNPTMYAFVTVFGLAV